MRVKAGPLADERSEAGAPNRSHLMAAAQRGDRDAYRRLLTEVTPYLRSLARRTGVPPDEVEDAVQDVLLTVHSIRHTFEPTRPFEPWLAAIARRRMIDRVRRHRRIGATEVELGDRHETFAVAETNLNERSGDSSNLRRAIEMLPAGQRQAIVLLKIREMSLKEAAVETGMSIAALKVATHRALKALRKMLRPRSET